MKLFAFLPLSSLSVLLMLFVGCTTAPPITKEERLVKAQAAIETVDRQADAVLAQAKKDLALAGALLEKTQHLDAKVQGHPIRNLANVYHERAIQLRLMALRYAQFTFAADDIAKRQTDSAKKTEWTQRAAAYSTKSKELFQLATHHADLAAHPEKIAAELLPATP